LQGGLFAGGIYIVQGTPGTAKTIFGNRLCFSQVARCARAFYVTQLAENHARMIEHMRVLDFFNERRDPRSAFLCAFQVLEQKGLKGFLELVRREVRTRDVQFLALDGLIMLHEKAASDLELKKFVRELQTQAAFSNCTMMLLTSYKCGEIRKLFLQNIRW
jgi:circadian clock protein KaiC